MGDNDGPVEEFTENEADEIVGVPGIRRAINILKCSLAHLLLRRFLK